MMNGMNNSSQSQNARSGLYPLEDILSAWLGILPTRSRLVTHWSGYVSAGLSFPPGELEEVPGAKEV